MAPRPRIHKFIKICWIQPLVFQSQEQSEENKIQKWNKNKIDLKTFSSQIPLQVKPLKRANLDCTSTQEKQITYTSLAKMISKALIPHSH